HKGYGLGVMVEILCGSLAGGSFGKALSGFDEEGKPAFHRLGHFFVAVNIESFVPVPVFKTITGSIMREIRSSKKVPGKDRVFLAGEKEFDMVRRRRAEGVPINTPIQKIMKDLGKDLGLTGFDFPFL
ncbi:Ldh family oxidoreductase, partial [archaeon]|nr:Ldh family oxidoreductase [archaeon]